MLTIKDDSSDVLKCSVPYAEESFANDVYYRNFVAEGNPDIYAKIVSTFIFDAEKLENLLCYIEMTDCVYGIREQPQCIAGRTYIPVENIQDLIEIIIARGEPLLLEQLFKQFYHVVQIMVGFTPHNISYFVQQLRSLSSDIHLPEALYVLEYLSPSLKCFPDVAARIDKGLYFVNKCGIYAKPIIQDCFGSLWRVEFFDQEIGSLLEKLVKLLKKYGSKSFYAAFHKTIKTTGVAPEHYLDWFSKLFPRIRSQFVFAWEAVVFFEFCVDLVITKGGKTTTFLDIKQLVTEFIDLCQAYHLPLDDSVFKEFCERDISQRPVYLEDLNSTYRQFLYAHENESSLHSLAAYFTVSHTGITYKKFISVLTKLKKKAGTRNYGPFDAYTVSLPLYETQAKNNRHPAALLKLALAFEAARFNNVDFLEYQHRIATQIASLAENRARLPQKNTQKPQAILIAKLSTAADLFARREAAKPPYATMIFALTLLGSSHKKLSYLLQFAGELLFRDILFHATDKHLANQLKDFEANVDVFSCHHVAALCEVYTDFLQDEIDLACDVFWPDKTCIPSVIEQLATGHRWWDAIRKTPNPCTLTLRNKLKEMVLKEFRSFWNYNALKDEASVTTNTLVGTCEFDFVPSKSLLDGFYGFIGSTCCAKHHTAILRPDFICVRMIDRACLRLNGVIHVLMTRYRGQAAILLAGIEPRPEVTASVDNQALWAAVKTWSIEFATAQHCSWILQTVNASATSNRFVLAKVIEKDISIQEIVSLDSVVTFPGISKKMARQNSSQEMADFISKHGLNSSASCYDVSKCVVLGRIAGG